MGAVHKRRGGYLNRAGRDRPIAGICSSRHDVEAVEISGQSYGVTVGSDSQGDGMYFEVADEAEAVLADVFYHDGNHIMTFTGYRDDLPLPLIVQAKEGFILLRGDGS